MKLLDLSLSELTAWITEHDFPAYRAAQLYQGLTAGKTPEAINIPQNLRELLKKEGVTPGGAEIYRTFVSSLDGTAKYLFRLEDGNLIEGVLMKYSYGNTLCLSTQVGCRMGCAFCASTLAGLVRNLTPGEMLGQVIAVNRAQARGRVRGVTNLVLMGSGEPLDNYDHVLTFLRRVTEKEGLHISQRNISVSTCGLVPGIEKLARENLGITLSLSLHAPNDAIRQKLMPVAKVYSIKETVAAMRAYVKKTGRRVVFEYALVRGLNDSLACAEELARLVRGMQCHVNLIPLNDVRETGLHGTGKTQCARFAQALKDNRVSVTVRREMGADIAGACGQLRRRTLEEEASCSISE